MKRRYGFVANSSTTAFIIDTKLLSKDGQVEFDKLKGWATERLVPQLIDTDTHSSQYCYLDDTRVLIYDRGDCIPDEINDAEVEDIGDDYVKDVIGKPSEYLAGIVSVLEEEGVEVTESMRLGLLHEVMKLILGETYSSSE